MQRLAGHQYALDGVRVLEADWVAVQTRRWEWRRRTFCAWDMWLMAMGAMGLATFADTMTDAGVWCGLAILVAFAWPYRPHRL